MTPKELNSIMLERLLNATVMTNQTSLSLGLAIKIINELLPLVTDRAKLEQAHASLKTMAESYKSGLDFGKQLYEDLKRLKSEIQ